MKQTELKALFCERISIFNEAVRNVPIWDEVLNECCEHISKIKDKDLETLFNSLLLLFHTETVLLKSIVLAAASFGQIQVNYHGKLFPIDPTTIEILKST